MPNDADKLQLQSFLFDVGLYIKERALEAKFGRDALDRVDAAREFESGRVLAFNEVISILQQKLQGFGLPLAAMQLEDIEPDRDLT